MAKRHWAGEDIDVVRQAVGDYVFPDLSIAIETKWSYHDFVESAIDGRLFRQIDGMNKEYKHSALFICGSFDDLYRDNYIDFGAEQNRGLIGRLLASNYSFVIENSATSCFKQMDAYIKNCQKDVHVIRPKPMKHKNAEPEERVLIALGVNIKQAQEILSFYTLRELHDVSIEELTALRGIGLRTAEKIKLTLY